MKAKTCLKETHCPTSVGDINNLFLYTIFNVTYACVDQWNTISG